jgi:hypothetical protein
MINLLFVIFVVAGFIAMFISTWPTSFPALRVAWGCWLIASIIWAVMGVTH